MGLRTLPEERPCTGSHWFLSRQRLRRALKGASTGRKSLLDSSDLRLERIVRQRQRHGFGTYPARVARVASSLREGRHDRVKCQSRACYSGEEILAVNWALPRGWYGPDERTPGAFLRRSEPKPLRVFALLEDEALALHRICTETPALPLQPRTWQQDIRTWFHQCGARPLAVRDVHQPGHEGK